MLSQEILCASGKFNNCWLGRNGSCWKEKKKEPGNLFGTKSLIIIMLIHNLQTKTLKSLVSSLKNPVSKSLLPFFTCTQSYNYVDVYMKWKKDPYYDSIEHIHKSIELKPIIALKNIITQEPSGEIPISAISKRGLEFDVHIKVARFLRMYPSFFEEFTGPLYNLPWFRLTQEALEIDREERRVYEKCRGDLRERLKRFILMSRERVLPLKIVKGMEWYLGLPRDFLEHPQVNLDGSFRFVEMEEGVKGLAVEEGERVLSVLQRNFGEPNEATIQFPIFPSKGLRLRRKIVDWLQEFQRLPYVSPYEDYSHLDPGSDVAEKRVVGFLHELLCLFVEHSAERKKLLCLKKHFGLPQKVHKAFERHPHIFYLSLRNKTCTAILKEAFRSNSVPKHPLSDVRKSYIKLLKDSDRILKTRRLNNRPVVQPNLGKDLDSDYDEEDRVGVVADCCV